MLIGFWILIVFSKYFKCLNLFDENGNICLFIEVDVYCNNLYDYEDINDIYSCLGGEKEWWFFNVRLLM